MSARVTGNQEIMQRLLANQRAQVEQELRVARAGANQGQVDQVIARLQRLAKFVGSSRLPNEDRQRTRDEAVKIQRDVYRKYVDVMLNEAISAARSDDLEKRGEFLKKARDGLSKAMVVGVEPEFAEAFEKMYQVVLETRPQGTSAKARIDKDTEWQHRSRPDELVGEKAKRRHLRFDTPTLLVSMNGSSFTTVNWAIGGLRMRGDFGGLRLGSTYDIAFRADGFDDVFHDALTVLRFEESEGSVAGGFARVDNKVVELIAKLRKAGVEPY
ncbi:MAG: hypothetical protein SF002_02995 [Alphaproteobacteria bacterium]|nr:hypothetical protein [Alphaproteobacteria bacterium]